MKETLPFILCGQEIVSDFSPQAVVNPYNDTALYQFGSASDEDIELAVAGALEARKTMKDLPVNRRSDILRGAAKFLAENRTEVVACIVAEAGKPLRYAQSEFERCLENLVLCSEQIKHLNGETLQMDASAAGIGRRGFWFREPVGIVLAISPFNFPLNLAAHKVAPAIAAGCPVILKPSSKTPGTALWLGRALLAAGLPPQAFSCLLGPGAKTATQLVRRREIAKITFTGSYQTGALIAAQAGIKKTTFELGSNSAAIVDESLLDFDYAVRRLCLGAFYYQGQVCISVQRIFVHKALFQRFSDAFLEITGSLKLGDPSDPNTEIGPMITRPEADRIRKWMDISLTKGARLLCGGKQEGSFIHPTVLTNVAANDPLACQEAFGPVVVIEPVDSVDEGIIRANSSPFGLQAGLFTSRIDIAEKAIDRLDVGGVIINDFPSFRLDHMPYGGVKDSGIGREGARFAIEEMSRIKMVVINNNTML